MKYKYLLLLLLMLPFVSGCNDSDDVNGIFTGNSMETDVYYQKERT